MLGKQKLHKDDSREIDEHDQPTEPLLDSVVSSFLPTVPYDGGPAGNVAMPMPQPFPGQPMQRISLPPYTPGAGGAYQYFPPQSEVHKGRNGRPPSGNRAAQPFSSSRARYRYIPTLVGLFFVVVQLLLVTRLILKILSISDREFWVSLVYVLSSLFVQPLILLINQLHLSFSLGIEVYTLFAIIAYALLSRILVRLLKICFQIRS
ncbi:hypothetical protein EPA93_20680 [Ktedonosporobacter rubrisoli]|uniref:YggT family protein n=1 Tax=Ktedonosporobacter rubrisoli TaxID=2509675 RepID=A0A4P6JSS2_KTERU|nr:hypothetical protein [Ktedonosporobacter rubrisoli]QBD78282.1 hypothetical protein EPA93_20680 [Ktedonosporobacter rubrisoli]